MKKVFFSSLIMLTLTFAFADNGNTEPRDVQPLLTNEVVVEQPQKTNVICEITLPGGTTISCGGCVDCDEFTEIVKCLIVICQ